MGFKRLGFGAAWNGLHHGCFNLKEIPLKKKAPNLLSNAAALDKEIPHLSVHHQVQIPLAIPFFRIF